jgi:hypothetical protein
MNLQETVYDIQFMPVRGYYVFSEMNYYSVQNLLSSRLLSKKLKN